MGPLIKRGKSAIMGSSPNKPEGAPPHSEKLPWNRRIKKRADFLSAQGTGIKFKTSSLLVCFLERQYEDSEFVRMGVTVTTKVDKRANKRNRIKRILKEIIRKQFNLFNKSGDLVLILMKGGVDSTYAELYEEVNFALKKLKLLKD